MAKNWEHAAGLVWKFLVEAAKRKETLTYSDIVQNQYQSLVGGTGVRSYSELLPGKSTSPSTAIVVGRTSGIPGNGFIAWDVDDIDSAQHEVFYLRSGTYRYAPLERTHTHSHQTNCSRTQKGERCIR